MIKIAVAATVGALGLAYLALTKHSPPKVCGSPCGLPVTSPRVKLGNAKHRVLHLAAAEETPSLHCASDGNTKAKESSGEPSKFICAICFDEKPASHRFKYIECNHIFCVPCMTKYAATQMHQNILKIVCPNPNCSMELKPIHFRTSLPLKVIDRWETVRCESLIAESEKTYCPFKDCSVLLVDDGGEVVTSAECPSCHRLFCAQCRVPWHGTMTCREYQREKRSCRNERELDNKFFKLAEKESWQKCPKCNFFVQRRSGCEHIKCRCGCDFCYHCGKNWIAGHVCKKRHSA